MRPIDPWANGALFVCAGDLLERWLRDVAAVKLRPRSLERYEGIVRRRLIPALGKVRLRSLTEQHIARAPTSRFPY